MQHEDCLFAANVATDFFGFVVVEGWFHRPGDTIASVRIEGEGLQQLDAQAGFCFEGVRAAFGDECGFRVKAFAAQGRAIDRAGLYLETRKGVRVVVSATDLIADAISLSPPDRLYRQFIQAVSALPGARLLDIGGRDRSGYDRSREFPDAQCTVFDILPSSNVDVVGDAHQLNEYFPPDHFDFAQSVSVYEHLAMPWVVTAHLNRVLKPGGLAFIATHHSIGLHDPPWDFWRFTDRAFHALFCRASGFEIVDTDMKALNFIVPMLYTQQHRDHEKAAGFEVTCVLARKVADTQLQWTVDMSSILKSAYPG